MRIEPASDMDEVRAIFREYAESTGLDLGFQNFEGELAALPDFYVAIFLARHDHDVAARVALRQLDADTCERKRLYVRPAYRGRDLGRTRALRGTDEARARGYRTTRLDTLPTMTAAMALYESLGFVDVEPYRYNPVQGS